MNRAAVLASLVLLPAIASADDLAPPSAQPPVPPPAAPAAQPAPQNEDWSNVSHINGTPVKVGERNDYLYAYKKLNISVNPFGPFFGYYDGAVSYGVSQNVAVSASFATWTENEGNSSGSQFTISAPIYFRRTYSGPFLEPGLIVRTTASNDGYSDDCLGCDSTGSSSSSSWFGPELLFGWHWTFDSGLNIAWAFGFAKHVNDDSSSSDSPDVNGYFRVGYAF